jgi:tetratricopeptide (TPR) repeat protein
VTTLGHFRIVAKIGESATGEVYRAEDEALRRHVALKVLYPALASDPEHKARFLDAARAASLVTHPHVAAVHEVGESDGRVWVAMELVEGPTLRSRLTGRPLPLLDTLRIAEQVAEGLAAAHDRNLAHGDLKAEKVVLGPGGQVKVVDLVLAAGTADPRDDVCRLGSMLYEMATGQRPPADASATIPPSTLNPDAPAELDRIIGTCLESDPADRYQHAGEIATDLERLRRRTETAPAAVMRGAAAKRRQAGWSARRIAAWCATAVVLVSALGLAGRQWIWPHGKPTPPFKPGDRILVADFVNDTGDIELGLALRFFSEVLFDPGGAVALVAVPRDTTKEVAAVDRAAAEARCLKGECEGYMAGRVVGDEKRYLLEIALYRAGRTEPVVELSSETDVTTIGHALESMLWDAARILRQKAGVGKPFDEVGLLSCLVWTGDANALKAILAWPMNPRGPAEALAGYRRGLELDPVDAALRWNLGVYLWHLGRRSEAFPHMKEGLRLWSAAAEERPQCRSTALNFEVFYLNCTWNYDAQAERLNRAVQLTPDGAGLWVQYGDITERVMGDPAAALPYYRKAYQIDLLRHQGGWAVSALASALLRLGEVVELDALIEEYRRRPPAGEAETSRTDRAARLSLMQVGAAYLRGDDYDALIAMIDRLVAAGQISEEDARWPRAVYLATTGRMVEAERWAREAATGAETEARTAAAMSGRPTAAGGYGLLDWLEKRRTGKVRVLEAAERDSYLESDGTLTNIARVSVDLDTIVSLKDVLRIVEEEQKDNRDRLVVDAIQLARGCRVLIEGRARQAVDLLEPLGRNYGPDSHMKPQHVLGRAYEAAGRWADAAKAYEVVVEKRRIWADTGAGMFGPVQVLDQHRLAGIYERLGNTDRARYWYGRFLNDWRSADPGTPEVEDAKKRLAALGGPLPAGG